MDAKEETLQLAKLAGIEKMVALLEEIAFNTSSKIIERPEYLRRIYASGVQGATAVHGGLRTQPETHGREMPVQSGSERVLVNPNRQPTRTQSSR